MKTIFIIKIALLSALFTAYGNTSITFDHLNTEDGLSNNSIRGIFQDNKGFLWFGTLNGLNRFDGKYFKVYSFDPENPYSISNNRVSQIYQDKLDYLWIITYDRKVHRLDPGTGKFLNLPMAITNLRINIQVLYIIESSPGVAWFRLSDGGCARMIYGNNPDEWKIDYIYKDRGLKGADVRFVYPDRKGAIWIGTSKGLIRLPYDTINFDNIDFKSFFYDNQPINYTTYCEMEGEIWFGIENYGIKVFDYKKDGFVKFEGRVTIENTLITAIIKEGENVVIGTNTKGLYLHNRKTGEMKNYSKGSGTLNLNRIEYIYSDRSGIVWLVSELKGVTLLEPVKKKFTYYPLSPDFRESIDEGDKQVFFEDSNNNLWIGIYGGGLFRLRRDNMVFEHFYYEQDNPGSLSSNFVLSIFEDQSKNLWIGTRTSGLNKVSLRKQYYANIQPVPNASLLYKNETRALLEDSNGNIWVGTKEGVLFCYDKNLKPFGSIPENPLINVKIVSSAIYALFEDKAGNLWIGTKGGGIYIIKGLIRHDKDFKGKNLEIIQFANETGNSNSLSANYVYSILEDKNGNFWIGTYLGGLNLLIDPFENPQFIHFRHDENNKYSLSDDRIRHMLLDKDQNLWIGTVNGLNFLKTHEAGISEGKFYRIYSNEADSNSLSYNDILYIFQDRGKEIWVGTYGGGLNHLLDYNLNTNTFLWEVFMQPDYPPKNVIYSIVEDNSDNLWMGTDFGLVKFYKDELIFEYYNTKYVIGLNTLSESGCLHTTNNTFLFGHTNGFICFNPDSIKKSEVNYPLVLTNFLLFDKSITPGNSFILKASIESTHSIVLDYNQNSIGFEFAVLDYSAPGNIHYAYILENYETQWNHVGNQNKALYRDLKPGNYVFKVMGTNTDGVWNKDPIEINIKIKKPFWKTSLAYIIYIVLIISLIWLIIYFIINEVKLKQKVVLEEKLTENKLKFYTSISHEFKAPLTLILGPAENLIADKKLHGEAIEEAKIIKRNTMRLLELIEQLLDFRKIQKGRFELKVKKTDLPGFIRDIYYTFLPLANKKDIVFNFNSSLETFGGWVDRNLLERVVFNLLSNAFKFTGKDKAISISVNIDELNEILKIRVEDEGKGIPKEDIPKIFERFSLLSISRLTGDVSSGIGLSLTKELIEIHKGSIEVESTVGKGSVFIVTIPCSKSIYKSDEIIEGQDKKHDMMYISRRMDTLNGTSKTTAIKKTMAKSNDLILVIEDNVELRDYMVSNLNRLFRVIEAMDGNTGLKLAKEKSPDLVVCDIMLPELNGIELCKILKNDFNTCHIPVIMITSGSSEDQKLEGIDIGADDFIFKPFSFQYLEKRIQNIISQRKILKEKFTHEPGIKPEKLSGSPSDQKFLTDVINMVEMNLDKPDFSIDKIVHELGYGRTVFYKKMKALTGEPPHDFVHTVKMKKAASMLRESEKSITAISYELGFSNPDYFTKTFKNYFGETPSEYHKKYRL